MKAFRLLPAGLAAAAALIAAAPAFGQEPAAAQEDPWLVDFAKASETAREQKKDILLDFTGSDWCTWCQKLDAEVFSKKEFLDEATKLFVLCRLDFLRKSPTPDKEAKDKVRATFKVNAFPTVLLMDCEGLVYARTGYLQGGPEAYLPHLKAMAERKALLAGMEKALSEAKETKDQIAKLEEIAKTLFDWEILSDRPSFLDRMRDLDPENAAGARFRAVAYRMILAVRMRSMDKPAFDAMKKELSDLVLKTVDAAQAPEAKAQALDAALAALRTFEAGKESLVGAFRDLLAKMYELDPENKGGFRVKYAADLLFAIINDRDMAAAEAQKKTIRELDPRNEHGQLERLVLLEANEFFRARKFAEAGKCVEDFFAAAKPKNDEITLRWAAGLCYFRAGDNARAVPHLKRVIEIQPDSGFAKESANMLRKIEEEEKRKAEEEEKKKAEGQEKEGEEKKAGE